MKLYKLLTQNLTTHNNFQWEVGKTYTIEKPGNDLCTDQVFHAYRSPETATLFNVRHANIYKPLCYSVETTEIVADDGLKVGVKSMQLVEPVTLPVFTYRQRVIFAILCARAVEQYLTKPIPEWDRWACAYMSGDTPHSYAAAAAARASVRANAEATASLAIDAADASIASFSFGVNAVASLAALAAHAAYSTVNIAADVAHTAYYTASTAADAAFYAHAEKINFTALAKQALTTL